MGQGVDCDVIYSSVVIDRYNNYYVGGKGKGGFRQSFPYVENDTGIVSNAQQGFIFNKFSPDGNVLWLRSTQVPLNSLGGGESKFIMLDSAGSFYVAGPFTRRLDFDPDAGVRILNSTNSNILPGATDFVVAKYSKTAQLLWVSRTTGSISDPADYSGAAYCPKTNSVTICGDYFGRLTFNGNTSPSYTSQEPSDQSDAFYATIANNCLSKTQTHDTICFGTTKSFDGETLTKPGKYIRLKSYNAANQCEVWEELYLHVRPESNANAGKDSTLCAGKKLTLGSDSIIKTTYTWQQIGGSFTSTKAKPNITFENNSDTLQTYKYAYQVSQLGTGCQKRDTVSIKVLPRNRSILSQAICKGQSYVGYDTAGVYVDTLFSQSGCDSIRTLTLSIKPIQTKSQIVNLCQGQSLQVGTRTYSTAGIYMDTLTASNGCDSIVTSTLNYSIPNDTIIVNGLSFSAANNQDSYQWLDCNAGFQIISGATQQSFTPPNNGSYAVRTTKGNCADTSNCVLFTSGKDLIHSQIRIYPLPVKDKLYIDMPETSQPTELIMMDAMGRIVLQEKGRNIQSVSVAKLQAGLYQLRIWRGKEMQVFGLMIAP
jgi:hypothetical protein